MRQRKSCASSVDVGALNETARQPLWVQAGEDLADDAVLARGIEALENEQEAALVLGVEPLLQDAQPLDELFPLRLAGRLVEAESLARVASRQARTQSGLNTELLDQAGRL